MNNGDFATLEFEVRCNETFLNQLEYVGIK